MPKSMMTVTAYVTPVLLVLGLPHALALTTARRTPMPTRTILMVTTWVMCVIRTG